MTPSLPDDHFTRRLTRIGRRWGDDHFDAEAGLVWVEADDAVHPAGHRASALVESCYYAFTLLETGAEPDYYRAAGILERVLPRQHVDPASSLVGSFAHESGRAGTGQSVADPYQTQLLGLAFAYILSLDDEQRLFPGPLKKKLDAAFRLTVLATLRQDVSASETTGAILSASLAGAGAALRRFEHTEDFGFTKYLQVYARAEPAGAFDEYLSPTDYGTNLFALHSGYRLGASNRIRAVSRGLLRLLWNDIEAAYHPPTRQIGGPHSRVPGEDVPTDAGPLKYYLFLASNGRYPLGDVETRPGRNAANLALVRSHEVARQIDLDAPRPASFERTELPPIEGRPDRAQSRYQDAHFSLGTISEEDAQAWRRHLLAYWRAEPGGRIGVARSAWQNLAGDARLARFYAAQAARSVLVALRVPTAAAPSPAFAHRLEFNLPGVVTPHPQSAGGWIVELPGVAVVVRPMVRPGAEASAATVAAGSDDAGTWLEWRWRQPDPGDLFYQGAFVVSFTPDEAIPEEVGDLSVREEHGALVFDATVDGEPLCLRLPPFQPGE